MEEEIIISKPEEFERKKEIIITEGKNKVYIVTDFDRTLTKAFVNGNKTPSIISNLRNGNYLTSDYSKKAHSLFNKYHPIEINPKISLEEKKKEMLKWWTSHFELLIKSNLNKKDLQEIVDKGKTKFRNGVGEFFDVLNKNKIPLLILSSNGVGETISMYFKKYGFLNENIKIITNSYKWDSEGYAIGVKKPIIHSMNKGEVAIKDFSVFEATSQIN